MTDLLIYFQRLDSQRAMEAPDAAVHHRAVSQQGTTMTVDSKARIRTRRPSPSEPGDHDRVSHYGLKHEITESMVMGTPLTALCGKTWVPSRGGDDFPLCQTCRDIWERLPNAT